MSNRTFLIGLTLAAIQVGATAQSMQRRAALVGGGNAGRGKCTIEVFVDGAAEVEIRGQTGILRNLSGNRPEWRRFECTSAMPANPGDFQFAGVDGRGRQELIRDPRNGGVAVVRIEDPDSGAEGYTFDLVWSNGNGSYPAGNDRNYTYDRNNRDDRNEPYDRYGSRDRVRNTRYSSAELVRACQDAVREQAAERYNARDVYFRASDLDNSGQSDDIAGVVAIRRGGREESFRYACTVDFNEGRIRSAEINPMDGYNRRDGRNAGGEVVASCQQAVIDRVVNDGYDNAEFGSINVDHRGGRNDAVSGTVRALRDNRAVSFNFSCVVDLNNGAVRSVDLRRR